MTLNRHTLTFISIFSLLFITLLAKKTSSPTPAPSNGPTVDSPISFYEHFELPLPHIGVQKKVASLQDVVGSSVAAKQLQATESRINEFKQILDKRMENPDTSSDSQNCLRRCQNQFKEALDRIKIKLESIDKRDFTKGYSNVNNCGTRIRTDDERCNQCYMAMIDEDKDIIAFEEWMKRMC